jgi:hypothetical protein
MKVLYTIAMDRRHVQESELLTSMVKDAVKDFNMRGDAHAKLEHVRFVTDPFRDGRMHRFVRPGTKAAS